MQQLSLVETVGPYLRGCYQLPKFEGKIVFHIVPLSGGIDSFAVGLIMISLFPDLPITFVHCDTGIEANGTEQSLLAFEKLTGRKVYTLKPKLDMLSMIANAGNFLPSQRQRSCTQMLKTLPIKRFYDALKAKHGEDAIVVQYVGIRADEPTRQGIDWKENHIASAYPLQALGLTKPDVNKIVNATIGIPKFYAEKSRSGCQICIFSRRSEIIDSWKTATSTLLRAAMMEELPDSVLRIYKSMPKPVSLTVGIARNWLCLYRPSRLCNVAMSYEEIRGKNKLEDSITDLFGASDAERLYVAVEYQYEDNAFGLCSEPFVYFEKIITYSTSLSGLKKALKHFWLHRLYTKEMYQQTEDELRSERQLQIIEIEIDDFSNEIPPKPDGVYTWQNDKKPLFAIRKTMAVIEHVLLSEGLHQATKSTNSNERKMAELALLRLKKEKSYGRILSSFEYKPLSMVDLVEDFEIVDAPVPCVACSR